MDYKFLFGEEWYEVLKDMLESDYWMNLGKTIANERKTKVVYPKKGSDLFFKAFRTTSFSKVKVVILGQDIYHDEDSYDGFAFSNSLLKRGRISPSLQNILKELHDDVYPNVPYDEWFTIDKINLERWANQGVLLINAAHTVVKGTPDSHTRLWREFTMKVIELLITKKKNIVWILWGNKARDIFEDSIDHTLKHHPDYFVFDNEYITKDNLILTSPHPSPFSAHAGFFGSKPFSKTNSYLKHVGKLSIVW